MGSEVTQGKRGLGADHPLETDTVKSQGALQGDAAIPAGQAHRDWDNKGASISILHAQRFPSSDENGGQKWASYVQTTWDQLSPTSWRCSGPSLGSLVLFQYCQRHPSALLAQHSLCLSHLGRGLAVGLGLGFHSDVCCSTWWLFLDCLIMKQVGVGRSLKFLISDT